MSHRREHRAPDTEGPTSRRGREGTRNTTRGAQISVRGNFGEVISQVRGRLNKANVQAFRGTCFGHLIDMPDIQCQGQLIYFLLTHLEPDSEVRNRLCFSINGRRIELGPQEFYCLSSLRFNEAAPPPASSDMHRDIFMSKPFMKAHDIDEKFESYSDMHRGADSLVLRLAMLHIVYGLLLNRDQLSKSIELEYLHLIDDYHTFNNFPWGKVAYQFLVKSTHAARGNIARAKGSSSRPSTDICGCSFVLQIFAFEVMPRLASHCAHRVPETLFPRFMNWTADQYFKAYALAPFFNDNAADSTVPFVLTSSEIARLESVGLTHDESSPPPVARRLSLIDEDDIPENEPEVEVVGSRAALALEVRRSPRKHVGSACSSRSKSRPPSTSTEPSKKTSRADAGAPETLSAISRMIVDSNALVLVRIDSLDKAIMRVERKVDALYKAQKHTIDGQRTNVRREMAENSGEHIGKGDAAGVDTNMAVADIHGNVADIGRQDSGTADKLMGSDAADADIQVHAADRPADTVDKVASAADNADIQGHASDADDSHADTADKDAADASHADIQADTADKVAADGEGEGVIDMSRLVELVAEACRDIVPGEEDSVAEDVDDDVLRAVDAYVGEGSEGDAVDTDVDISFLSEEESDKGEAPPATTMLPVKRKLFIPEVRPYEREQLPQKKAKPSRARAKPK
ncbi:hypothetical protein C2S51_014506 [Perilla frutescens var. frutescens]|nr:hypothetical protein C2S51_014506 [Perilla frutescens var. frutescens]